MPKIQIFFDYECPYCKRGYETFMELLPSYPGLGVDWCPVEAHPRPENHHPHTDLCLQAHYIALELGAEMSAFVKTMFQCIAVERQNVEKPEVLADLLKGIADTGKFLEILNSKKYISKIDENNDLAYEKNGVWFIPSFRVLEPIMKDPPKLDAKGGIGVTREEIIDFLNKIIE